MYDHHILSLYIIIYIYIYIYIYIIIFSFVVESKKGFPGLLPRRALPGRALPLDPQWAVPLGPLWALMVSYEPL